MDIRIRPYCQRDYRYLREMVFSYHNTHTGQSQINNDKIEDTVIELCGNPTKGTILIFEYDEEICGYAILIAHWSNIYGGNILSIDELYIKEQWRNKGIAARFLNVAHLSHEKVVGIRIEAASSHQDTRGWLIRLGFREMKGICLHKEMI